MRTPRVPRDSHARTALQRLDRLEGALQATHHQRAAKTPPGENETHLTVAKRGAVRGGGGAGHQERVGGCAQAVSSVHAVSSYKLYPVFTLYPVTSCIQFTHSLEAPCDFLVSNFLLSQVFNLFRSTARLREAVKGEKTVGRELRELERRECVSAAAAESVWTPIAVSRHLDSFVAQQATTTALAVTTVGVGTCRNVIVQSM